MPPTRPFIATVLLLGVVLCTSPAHAQQPAASSGPDLESIREQFRKEPTESRFLGPIRADYAVRIEEEAEDLDYRFAWIYDRSTMTPGYVRPWYPIYHFEMQSMMIPEEFRAHLYPIGVPVGDIVGAFKDAARKRREREAKKQVEAEVRALRKK